MVLPNQEELFEEVRQGRQGFVRSHLHSTDLSDLKQVCFLELRCVETFSDVRFLHEDCENFTYSGVGRQVVALECRVEAN